MGYGKHPYFQVRKLSKKEYSKNVMPIFLKTSDLIITIFILKNL